MFKTSGIFRVFQSQIKQILTDSHNAECDIYVKWPYFDKMTYLRTYWYDLHFDIVWYYNMLCYYILCLKEVTTLNHKTASYLLYVYFHVMIVFRIYFKKKLKQFSIQNIKSDVISKWTLYWLHGLTLAKNIRFKLYYNRFWRLRKQ